MSKKRAAAAVKISRAALYRVPKGRSEDTGVVEALNQIVGEHPRWGFWKCFNRLRLLGHGWIDRTAP